ncbi:MAG: flippase-like domain-containing protein [Zoogloeaceae bacterium]|nr:flippase-like domain-containing protein [Zoogloeaceae bacterium]
MPSPALDAAPETPAWLSGGRLRALLWPVFLAILGYLGFALWSGWEDVAAAARKIGLAGIGLALVLSLVNYALRFIRWQMYLAALGHRVAWRPSLRIYLAGFALTATPGKAGEALRGLWLQRWRVPFPDSLAAFLSERLSDLLAILLLVLIGLAAHPSMRWLVIMGAAGMLLAFLLVFSQRLQEGLARRVRGEGGVARLLHYFLHTLRQTRRCHSARLFAAASVLSLIAWFAEAFALYLLIRWMGHETLLAQAVFVYAVSMLAGALSFLPGGLGGAEAVMGGLLVFFGMSGPEAVATTILIRASTLWFAVAIGLAASCRYLQKTH